LNNFLITFFSTHQALKAEKILKNRLSRTELIPTPREINSECGFCIHLRGYEGAMEELMKDITFEHIYRIDHSKKGVKTYERTD